jgi:uncharacterized protein YndB with AHSA1/START domain
MVTVETSVLIDQPIDKVFEYVTTPENDHEWYIGIESKKTSESPTGVGSTSESQIRFLGVHMTVGWEVTEYESPTKIGVKTSKGPVKVTAMETFEPMGESQTKVGVHGEADVSGVFHLAEPIVERMAQRQWEASFENLKDVMEAQG